MNAQQIAAEAWQEIRKLYAQYNGMFDGTAIILSAIEKAFPELTKAALRLDDMLRAAGELRDKLELTDAAYAELERQFVAVQSRAAHAIEKATYGYEAAVEQAIDILVMQDNAGKGRSQAELSRRIEQAISMLRQSRAAHASEKPKFNLETLEGRKAAWAWLQQQFGNPLVVTKDGIPFEDQAEGIRQFKDAARKPAHASDAWIGERCKFCNEDEGKHKHDCQRPQPAHAREQQIDNDSNYHLYPQ